MAATAQAQGTKRVALVIGNNDYEHVPVLQKAVNDSHAISQELARLGFEVVSAENVGRGAMSRALVELEGKIETGDTALIYYRRTWLRRRRQQLFSPGRRAGSRARRGRPRVRCVLRRERPVRPAAREGRGDSDPHSRCQRDNPFTIKGKRSIGLTRGLSRMDPA